MNIGPAMAGFLGPGRITFGPQFGGVFGGVGGFRWSARCSAGKITHQTPRARDPRTRVCIGFPYLASYYHQPKAMVVIENAACLRLIEFLDCMHSIITNL